MRRKVQFRISDETGINLDSVSVYILRSGGNIASGGATSISAGGTDTVWLTHPGSIKKDDQVLHRDSSDNVTDVLTVDTDPTWSDADSVFKVDLLNGTGSSISVGSSGRMVLNWSDSDSYVTWYDQDVGGNSTAGVISPDADTGEVEFYVEEHDVDLAIVQNGALVRYFPDVPSEKRAYLTVEEFGAVGDGVTDDSVAFQTAVDYSIEHDLGPIQLEAKTYLINTTVDVPDTIHLKGKTSNKLGTNMTKITRTGTNKLFTIGGTDGNNIFRPRIEDIWFNGGDTDEVIIDFSYISFLHVSRCKTNGTTNYGFDMVSCWEVYFDDNDFSFLGDSAGSYAAIRITDCNNFRFRGCHFETLRGKAVVNRTATAFGAGDDCNLIFFENCKFESPASVYPAIDFISVVGTQVKGGVFSQARSGSTNTCEAFLKFTDCRWLTIDTIFAYLADDPGVTDPELTQFLLFDSCEGVQVRSHIQDGQDNISGSYMVKFDNVDETEAHNSVRITYLPGSSPSAARTNLGGYDIPDSVIRFNDTANQIATYAGSPNGNVTGDLGDLCLDTTNGELYYKDSGSGTDTGWVTPVDASGFTATGDIDMDGNNVTMGGGTLDLEGGVIAGAGGSQVNQTGSPTSWADVATVTVAQNSLGGGDVMKITAFGSVSGTTDTKDIRLRFGSTDILQLTQQAAGTEDDWSITAVVSFSSGSVQKATATSTEGDAAGPVDSLVALTEDLTAGDLDVAVQANLGSGSDSVTVESLFVEYVGG